MKNHALILNRLDYENSYQFKQKQVYECHEIGKIASSISSNTCFSIPIHKFRDEIFDDRKNDWKIIIFGEITATGSIAVV